MNITYTYCQCQWWCQHSWLLCKTVNLKVGNFISSKALWNWYINIKIIVLLDFTQFLVFWTYHTVSHTELLPFQALVKCLTLASPNFNLGTGKGTFSSEYQAIHKVQIWSKYTVQIPTMIINTTPLLLTRRLHYTFTLTTYQNTEFFSDYKQIKYSIWLLSNLLEILLHHSHILSTIY
jgi:hypothetical protein